MATTVEQIIERAYATSFKNRPGTIATAGTELVDVVARLLMEMFVLAADENPDYFGNVAQVAYNGTSWPRPAAAESVTRLEVSGAEVVVVPYDQRTIEAGTPAVYERGGQFYSAGNAGDPTSGTLTVFFSDLPAALVDETSTLDARWPERFNPILELGLAGYLARKDSRPEEAAGFEAERARWVVLFSQHLRHATANLIRQTRIPARTITKHQATTGGA